MFVKSATKNNEKMKANKVLKDLLLVASASAIALLIVRNYQKHKRKERQMREFVHFQLF